MQEACKTDLEPNKWKLVYSYEGDEVNDFNFAKYVKNDEAIEVIALSGDCDEDGCHWWVDRVGYYCTELNRNNETIQRMLNETDRFKELMGNWEIRDTPEDYANLLLMLGASQVIDETADIEEAFEKHIGRKNLLMDDLGIDFLKTMEIFGKRM